MAPLCANCRPVLDAQHQALSQELLEEAAAATRAAGAVESAPESAPAAAAGDTDDNRRFSDGSDKSLQAAHEDGSILTGNQATDFVIYKYRCHSNAQPGSNKRPKQQQQLARMIIQCKGNLSGKGMQVGSKLGLSAPARQTG